MAVFETVEKDFTIRMAIFAVVRIYRWIIILADIS